MHCSANDNGGEPALTHDVTVSVNVPPTFTGSPFAFSVNNGSTQGKMSVFSLNVDC